MERINMNNDFLRLFPSVSPWLPSEFGEQQEENEALVRDFTNQKMTEPPNPIFLDESASNFEKAQAAAASFSDIPAGYTYFGQFVDHDITRDETPLEVAEPIHGELTNHRTPTLDLDSVYRGAILDNRFEISNGPFSDLPRGIMGKKPEEAAIGDSRNDENSIVCQVHLAFLLAHNELMDRQQSGAHAAFMESRRILTWLYQHIVLNDFLPRIVRSDILNLAIRERNRDFSGHAINFNLARHQIPAEFSKSAYRFGHSMVRNSYQTNAFGFEGSGFGKFIKLFDSENPTDPDLRGFRTLLAENTIQWDWFLTMASSAPGLFPQRAQKIDTKLADALTKMHEGGGINNILATRNILRGVRTGMSQASGVTSVVNAFLDELSFNGPRASFNDVQNKIQFGEMLESLWVYILAEAEVQGDGKLGVLGSTIVSFTFIQLIMNTPNSFLNVQSDWDPGQEALLKPEDNQDSGNWSLASIIRLSGLRVS